MIPTHDQTKPNIARTSNYDPNLIFTIASLLLAKSISTTITAPIHFVQTRYQVMSEMKKNNLLKQNYSGYYDCLKSAVRQEGGISALFKGNLAKILSMVTSTLFARLSGDKTKKYIIQTLKGNKSQQTIYLKIFSNIAGFFASYSTMIISYPIEYAYVRLVTDKANVIDGKKKFKGINNVIFETIKSDGIRGIYRGVFTSFGGVIAYRLTYFGLYDLCSSSTQLYQGQSLYQKFFVSYLITLTAGAITYPISTIRKRMMMRSMETERYSWSGSCARNIIKNEGILALYRAYPMNVLSAISGAFLMMGYDSVKARYFPSH